jgi:uncharacterized protein YyaL (SSP411 family)
MTGHQGGRKENRLASEKSPYLLQHAQNPVDWYPWGPEAFQEAKDRDRPIFLSIGYSTCHWCHVMERESFEDQDVADLLNGAFINIKVDREERPDIDNTYMAVCQIMTGSGGWPLTIIMTPEKKPFFASTYIPRETRFGQTGLTELIPRIRELWSTKREQIVNSAQETVKHLLESEEPLTTLGNEKLGEEALDEAYDVLSGYFDDEHGGFGASPKFPTAHNLTFLLRYWKRRNYEKALWMVEKTLKAMRLGGIYDHIGFGFHRYSIDSRWLQPHFEKMLYDQAMLTIAYAESYQATRKAEYREAAEEILSFVLRDMTSPTGGFYTSIDADSERQEGKYYLWKEKEIESILTTDEAGLVTKIFNITEKGNYSDETTHKHTGNNTLNMTDSIDKISSDMKIPKKELEKRLETARNKLFAYRQNRIHPSTDNKILTDLNGLMIAAFAISAQVFHEPKYLVPAIDASKLVLSKIRNSGGRLLHRYMDGESAILGFLDDYSFFVWGLIELYEATFETGYLLSALKLTEDMVKHFWDEKNGGFYISADDAENILIKKKDMYDGAHPCGNSVAALNLMRLAHITGKPDFEQLASRLLAAFSRYAPATPTTHTHLLSALDFAIGPSSEVVIVGEENALETSTMIEALQSKFIPNKVVIFKSTGKGSRDLTALVEYASDLAAKENKTTAYVCRGYKCALPVTDPVGMLELLDRP